MEVTGTVDRVSCRQEAVFDWKIKDFPEILGRGDYSCKSLEFKLCGHTWYLQLDTNDQSESIVLILWSKDLHAATETPCSLGIRSASGKTEMEVTGIRYFSGRDEKRCGAIIWIKKSELLERREELLPLEVLTVTATLREKIAAGDATVEGSRGRKRQRTDGEDERLEKTGTERVLQDIGKMWPSDEHSDVVFRVRDVEFKAHRAILWARTPALGAMFRHDTAEMASGLATIEDCEPAVFEQLLHYVYKGVPRKLTAENVFPLFAVAEKYRVSEVKTLCVRYMRDTLCEDTVCKALTVALTHKEDELLEAAVDFFSRNLLGIIKTVQWRIFNRDHSTWANEIMTRVVKIREEKRPDGD